MKQSPIDAAQETLAKSLETTSPLQKAHHDAMHHHAVHALAASIAGKPEEASAHRFMHMRHALENARHKGYHGMGDAMKRNIDHYNQEASDDVHGGHSWQPGADKKRDEHKAVKHFKGGGGFVGHPSDKSFKTDYEHGGKPKMKG